ncbi:MAG: response regulator [FCB group bacterium]|nr:response regulator [FCB group bacterium]
MSKAKILIVEDEMVTAEDLRTTLIRMDYEPIAVISTGEMAVKKAAELNVDLVLMDVKLKGKMDGVEAAGIIHESYGIPVIYLTAYADNPLLERAKLTGPYGYVVKPFSEKELHSSVEIALFKSQSDKQIAHLNSVLKAIRNINQLITHEKNPKHLIRRACEMMVDSRGYGSSWIILLNNEGEYVDSAETGVGKQFQTLVERYKKLDIPVCCKTAKRTEGVIVMDNIESDCPDCPLAVKYKNGKCLQARLSHQDRIYGFMSVGVSQGQLINAEELELIEEVSDDLAFALYTFEADLEKRKLEAQLIQSQKLEAIGSLVSGVVHEINNPLTGMINYADLIEEKMPEGELKEYAQGIMFEGNRVAGIVKNLLAFSRTSQNVEAPVSLSDVILGTLSLVQPTLRKDQITLETDLPDNLDSVVCNSQQIRQVVLNLITNASHALNKRYKRWDDDKRLIIKLTPLKRDGIDWQQIVVEDHGVGIPKNKIDKIFDEFYTTKPEGEGTGLGLSVSKKIIDDHGGTLSVESKENKFTRFFIDLKVTPDKKE